MTTLVTRATSRPNYTNSESCCRDEDCFVSMDHVVFLMTSMKGFECLHSALNAGKIFWGLLWYPIFLLCSRAVEAAVEFVDEIGRGYSRRMWRRRRALE